MPGVDRVAGTVLGKDGGGGDRHPRFHLCPRIVFGHARCGTSGRLPLPRKTVTPKIHPLPRCVRSLTRSSGNQPIAEPSRAGTPTAPIAVTSRFTAHPPDPRAPGDQGEAGELADPGSGAGDRLDRHEPGNRGHPRAGA
jgi:hypothetical protein